MSEQNCGEPNSSQERFRGELSSTLRKVDQGITAHSILRDSFAFRSRLLGLGLVLASGVIAFLAVASDAILRSLFDNPEWAERVIAICGVAILIGTVVNLHFGWGEQAARHADAANSLGRFKLLLNRELVGDQPLNKAKFVEIKLAYENLSDLIARVPESKFLSLKASHRRKVEISKLLDNRPSANIALLRLKLWVRDNICS